MTAKKPDALARPTPTARVRFGEETRIEVGQWYWVDAHWLGCVTRLGSNYAKLEGPGEKHAGSSYNERIHFDEFEKRCTLEENPEAYLRGKVELHQKRVEGLLNDIKLLTARLGISPLALRPAGEAESSEQALVAVHGVQDIKQYKADLILAKDKTLPDLFKEVKREHEMMAHWQKAALIPFEAQAKGLERHTAAIKDRIFIVELYAGLCEQLVQIQEGEPAEATTKLSLFQRRHYMDEECLYNYEAGGMRFHNIGAFDKWLLRPENLKRLLPYERSVVAFQVRRYEFDHRDNDEEPFSFRDFIRMWDEHQNNRRTYLYFRNGEQVFYLETGIEFGAELFPDREHAELEGKDLWVQLDYHGDLKHIVTTSTKEEHEKSWRKRIRQYRQAMREYRKEYKAWQALSEEEQEEQRKLGKRQPWQPSGPSSWDKYTFEPLTPESVQYDDAMKRLTDEIKEHNRMATVLQGVLDRSPAFQPHPPWQLFTREGFTSAIDLVYDQTRALVMGDPPSFVEYRAQCNRSIRAGTMTIGQQDYWLRAEAVKENKRRQNDYRRRRDYDRELVHFWPYDNPGPGRIARVVKVMRNGDCVFEWTRQRQCMKYRWDEGYTEAPIKCRIRVPREKLFNLDAYEKGEYRLFFDDPRTRADYCKWAPYLLTAEDYLEKRRRSRLLQVHCLDKGSPLCSFSYEKPIEWPEGHRWVDLKSWRKGTFTLNDKTEALCWDCQQKVQELREEEEEDNEEATP